MNVEKLSLFFKKIHAVRWAAVLILINLLLFAFIVLPKRNRIVSEQSHYAELRNKVIDEQRNVRRLQQRLLKLQQARIDLRAMYAQVLAPKRTGVTDIRLELESLLSGLRMQGDFAYTNQSLPEFGLHVLKLSLPVQGSYPEIRQFINDIERSRYFLILDRVDLTSQERSDLLNLNFSLSTYLVEGARSEQ
jgi:Tfp pilus assembly protein PilO